MIPYFLLFLCYMTTEDFIEKAKKVHGDKYDYSQVKYINTSTKVCIICPKHGEFWQTPNSHLQGSGCPSCSNVKKRNAEETFVEMSKLHNNKYTYHDDFQGIHKKIRITCPIHGDFYQLAKKHLKGQGCPLCAKINRREYNKNNYKSFVKESKKRFGDIFSFPNIEQEYENSHSKITIVCNTCGNSFTKIACDHLTSPHGGCTKCFSQTSKFEEDVKSYIKTLCKDEEIIFNDRTILDGLEIDIYIPSLHIGFECNGLFWHSEYMGKNKFYHLHKTETAKKKNVDLIHIFEDEYMYRKNILFEKIKHILKKDTDKPKIMARKCTIQTIDVKTAKTFLENNHIQGFASASVHLGCFFNQQLVGVMSFLLEDKITHKWNLVRFATDNNVRCQGVGGKLFSYFTNNYVFTEIKSFADKRWMTSSKNIYETLGFTHVGDTKPNYSYIKGNDLKRYHKFNFRKNILHKKYGLPLTMTETEMCNEIKAYKVWDCGLLKYIYSNNNLFSLN